jgi:hypothetical protein
MSWETRGNNRYYYRRRKVNGRVESEYIGAGGVAELLAAGDDLARQRRQLEAAEWRAIVEADRRQSDELAEVEDLVTAATAAVLIANGYHTHKRQWRKAQ